MGFCKTSGRLGILVRHCLALVILLGLSHSAGAQQERPLDNWSGFDKALHFSASTALSAGSYGIFALVFDEPWQRAIGASTLTLTIGTLKEIADMTNGSIFSYHDMAYNIFGTMLGIGIALGADYTISFFSCSKTPTVQIHGSF